MRIPQPPQWLLVWSTFLGNLAFAALVVCLIFGVITVRVS